MSDWQPFVYGGIASVVAEFSECSFSCLLQYMPAHVIILITEHFITIYFVDFETCLFCRRHLPNRHNQNSASDPGPSDRRAQPPAQVQRFQPCSDDHCEGGGFRGALLWPWSCSAQTGHVWHHQTRRLPLPEEAHLQG